MDAQYLWDVEGKRYLDLHGGYGTAALGYNDPVVRSAVVNVLQNEGVLFGTPHPREVQLSELLVKEIPSAEMVALCGGGGSDPLYFGFRLARSVTGRRRLLKFEGEYHGWHDPLAVSVRPDLQAAGPQDSPRAVPLSSGSAEGSDSAVIGVLNDVAILEGIFEHWGQEIACAVVEPVCHSSGCIPLSSSFLQRLRQLCTEYGVVMMLDEIMTGFRHSVRGAQSLIGVIPDLSAFGKAMANGFPIAALVGRRDLMSQLSPLGSSFYSGTFNGHLVSVAAAQTTIAEMLRRDIHAHTFELGDFVRTQINAAAQDRDIRAVCQSFGSIFSVYFGVDRVTQYRDIAHMAQSKDFALNRNLQVALLHAGIYMQPYSTNRCFLSAAHTRKDIEYIVDVVTDFMCSHRDEINQLPSSTASGGSG